MISIRPIDITRLVLLIAACALWTATRSPARASVCTLADHIRSANTNTAVGFCPPGTSHDIITITEDITLTEPLPPITGTITIEGGGHAISGDGKYRLFDVDSGGRLTVKNLSLIAGQGGVEIGGAIRLLSDAQLSVESATFRNNSAKLGGAIGSRGVRNQLSVRNSRFISNSAEQGGALSLTLDEAVIDSSSFSRNLAWKAGGAIVTWRGGISISNSTFHSNVANTAGAVYVDGGIVTLTHLTMLNNAATGGTGAGLRKFKGIASLRNSIIAGSVGATACFGRLAQIAGTLIEDGSCDPEYSGDPKLELVAGAELTYVPRDDSPAINAAYRQFCPDRDQIGTARPQGGACDIGAIESTSATATGAGPLAGVCTLADRILAANSNQAVGNCPAGTDHDIITITEDIILRLELPPITGSVTIEGGGHTISGDKRFRIFTVSGGNLTVNNLILTEGFSDGEGGGAIQARAGGRLTVNDSKFIANVATHGGGAIDMTGSKGFEKQGGRIQGVTASAGGLLTVNDSHFFKNKARGGYYSEGGAIRLSGSFAISNSSFISNYAGSSGGAISGSGDNASISNSTFSGNRAWFRGGALNVGGSVKLTHLTLVDNLSSRSEGRGRALDVGGNVFLRNSVIVGGPKAQPLCAGRLAENTANLISDGSCTAPMRGEALLEELIGSPAHHPPLDGSPALDSADPRFCPDADQLGTPRPHGGGCDLGAIESTTALAAPPPVVPPPPCPLDLQITAANTDAPAGGCPAGSGHDVITLTEDIALDAPLPPITSEITIDGRGYTISGSHKFRLFDVDGGLLTISNMTLRDGNAMQGGAIRLINGARVNAANLTFSDNLAGNGGAIATESSNVRLNVSDSRFVGNRAEHNGGALLIDGGAVNIEGSAFLENSADSGGRGGAAETRKGNVAIANTTFSGNWAGTGGAIYSHGADTTLTHVTLMNNRAIHIVGANIYHHSGALNLRNSIVAGSGRGDDCYGRPTQNRGNLSQDGTCITGMIGDPLLAEMTGAVTHYPLQDASPAHAAADPAFCLPTDQLGNPRPFCDIGAVESERAVTAQAPLPAVIPADCALADQIIAANTDAPAGACPAGKGADLITLRSDIKLSEPLPTIKSDLTILGNGHTIDADNRFRIFDIEHGVVNIKDMTLINGSRPGDYGGAILARGDADVVVALVTFRKNRAGWGAGIATRDSARLNVPYSNFFDNAAEEKGGAIWFNSSKCYNMANPMLGDNISSTEIPDPQYEIFAPHLEFALGAARQCETERIARQ